MANILGEALESVSDFATGEVLAIVLIISAGIFLWKGMNVDDLAVRWFLVLISFFLFFVGLGSGAGSSFDKLTGLDTENQMIHLLAVGGLTVSFTLVSGILGSMIIGIILLGGRARLGRDIAT